MTEPPQTITVDVGTYMDPKKVTCVAMPEIRNGDACRCCCATETSEVLCNDLPDCEGVVWVDIEMMHEYIQRRLE